MLHNQHAHKGFFSKLPRSSGILLHLTSLPGACGIGDLGPGALRFVDFLKSAGQKYWQILPYGPTDPCFGNSPYTSFSAFAGNHLLISPELLIQDGLLDNEDLNAFSGFPEDRVAYSQVIDVKNLLFEKAFFRFQQNHNLYKDFDKFCGNNAVWLYDYCLFISIRTYLGTKDWSHWPIKIARRNVEELDHWRSKLSKEIEYQVFLQYCFYSQWRRLREYARSQGIELIGDLPIYVSYDSADVWSNPHLFDLAPETLSPVHVAGVPPDYFSETGQRWGNPPYQWTAQDGKPTRGIFEWWVLRLRFLLEKLDIVRVDHFRGFEAYWEIPAEEETAVKGRWAKGPGIALFEFLEKSLNSNLPIIAEDLGVITPDVEMLRDNLGLPGMKVLQFAFDSGPGNQYLPFNYTTPDCVVYTGTHDNDTTRGWFLNSLSKEVRTTVINYLQCNDKEDEISWQMIRYALSSTARLAITPMQDVLALPGSCRMNTPGLAEGNWTWRCTDNIFSEELQNRLASLTRMFGR